MPVQLIYAGLPGSAGICHHLSFTPRCQLNSSMRVCRGLPPSEIYTQMPAQLIYAGLCRHLPPSGCQTQMPVQLIYADLSESAAICHHLAFTPRCQLNSSMQVCKSLPPSAIIWLSHPDASSTHLCRSARVCRQLPSSGVHTQVPFKLIYAGLQEYSASCQHLAFTPRCHLYSSERVYARVHKTATSCHHLPSVAHRNPDIEYVHPSPGPICPQLRYSNRIC
jgi:hypothetical protein